MILTHQLEHFDGVGWGLFDEQKTRCNDHWTVSELTDTSGPSAASFYIRGV